MDTISQQKRIDILIKQYGFSEEEARYAVALKDGEISGDILDEKEDRPTIMDLMPEVQNQQR